MRPDWDTYFCDLATTVATRADCTRRQVGAVIVDQDNRVISTGYNGAPAGQPGCATDNACPRGQLTYAQRAPGLPYDGDTHCIALHAEHNAVLYARRDLKGCRIYITDDPCTQCTQLLIAVGVEVVGFKYSQADEAERDSLNAEYNDCFEEDTRE